MTRRKWRGSPGEVLRLSDLPGLAFLGSSDLHCDAGRDDAPLDSGEQALLAMVEQIADRVDVLFAKIRFGCDLAS